MEQFFQVVLQGSSCQQQLVLEGVTVQHTEELGSREQGRNGEEKNTPTNKTKTHKRMKGLSSHKPTKIISPRKNIDTKLGFDLNHISCLDKSSK